MSIMRVVFILLSAVVFSVSASVLAATPVPPDPVVEKCGASTPSAETKAPAPEHFGMTNNLRRKTGSPLVAKGTPIVIYGKLLDERCVPISDARVEVWQGDRAMQKGKIASSDPNFVGSGVSVSNNLGQFTFLTVLPPHTTSTKLHVRILRENQPTFKTVIYVEEGASSSLSPLTARQDTLGITSDSYGTPYYITMTLDQDRQYRKY